MNPQAKHSLISQGALLFVLSGCAIALLGALGPRAGAEKPLEVMEQAAAIQPAPVAFPATRGSEDAGFEPQIADRAQGDVASPVEPEAVDSGVGVIKSGRINLTADQRELLKGGASWGDSSSERQQLIDSIPDDSFSSDW